MTPLSGTSVLDLTKVLAGPLCTQYLGDLGADVIKVEPTITGDDTRRWPPFRGEIGAVFLSVNRNKRSLAIDLKSEDGQAILRKLAAKADVVIQSYAPGADARLGIDDTTLRALNPRLIHCSISGFGSTGPLKAMPGYDVILQAFSGMMGLTGHPGGEPVRSPISPIDQATGMHALSGILAALLERGRTGLGTRIEVSLFETAMAFLAYNFQSYWEKGVTPEKCGSSHESLVPYQAFLAADKPILIGVANDNLWRKFCCVVERPDLAQDLRFRTGADRAANRAQCVSLVQAIVQTRTCDEWLDLLRGLGVPCAPINTLPEALDHPQTKARGIVLDTVHPLLGAMKGIAYPVQFNGAPRAAISPPPMLGEHSCEILREIGTSEDDIMTLLRAGTVLDGRA